MDPFIALFSWQFVLFSLVIAGITYPLRLIIDYCIASSSVLKFWQDVVLPIVPIPLGAVLAVLVSSFPFPNTIASTITRAFWGLVAGMFSSIMFRSTKAMLLGGNLVSSSAMVPDPLGRARNVPTPRN